MKEKIIAGLLFTLSCFTHAADPAQQGNIGRWFIGGGFGDVGFDDGGFSEDLEDNTTYYSGGWYYGDIDTDADDTALLLKTGYRFNRIVGLEISYIDYGDVVYEINGQPFFEIGFSSISVAANLGYTFDSGWRPFVLLGLSSVDADFVGDSERYGGFHYGFGGEYTPPAVPMLTFRLSFEGDVFVDDSVEDDYGFDEYVMDIGTFALGFTLNF